MLEIAGFPKVRTGNAFEKKPVSLQFRPGDSAEGERRSQIARQDMAISLYFTMRIIKKPRSSVVEVRGRAQVLKDHVHGPATVKLGANVLNRIARGVRREPTANTAGLWQ